MIELQRHIEILLLTNDCVIVPGLGGFMAHHVEARFDEADNTFVPPLRTLGFNQNLTMNDSLLVQSYIECYDISYPEALRRIEDEVCELRQHLQTEGSYELTDIGVLSLNEEGNLEFHPCEAGILTPGLYGLGTFDMHPLTTGQERGLVATDVVEERAIVIKMSWLRHAVAVAAAVVAFFVIGTPLENSYVDSQPGVQQSSLIPLSPGGVRAVTEDFKSPSTDSSMSEASPIGMPSDNISPTLVPTLASEGAVAGSWLHSDLQTLRPVLPLDSSENLEGVPADVEPSQETVAVQPQADEYCIVLASQVSQRNADGFVEQLKNEGFADAYIVNKRFRRVLYGHFATKDEAALRLRELRAKSKKNFGEAWVMKSNY